MNSRSHAVKVLYAILQNGTSLALALPKELATASIKDPALTQAICYGVLRYYEQLEFILNKLLPKPLKEKDIEVKLLLLVGLFQLQFLSVPPAIVLNETVNAVKHLRKNWATGLVNAVLRQYLRQKEQLTLDAAELTVLFNSPAWLIKQLQLNWPEHWSSILNAQQQKPSMTLRVNLNKISRENYQQLLAEKNIESSMGEPDSALILTQAISVEKLPHFHEGYVSVQDAVSQFAAYLLDIPANARVLDACAAPGGKTCHMLELYPTIEKIIALDIDATRLEKLTENLNRLKLSAQLSVGDAAHPDSWWDGILFDRILCDAPCSATGVIRRHPDIKFLREETDIPVLAEQQLNILKTLWSLLKPGGKLLYSTCSILPQENVAVITKFLQQEKTATPIEINLPEAQTLLYGQQILPGNSQASDGFYYAMLQKI